jgi:hypothetical protein
LRLALVRGDDGNGVLTMRSLACASAVALLSLFECSCFVVTDLDRFKSAPAGTGSFDDLKLTLQGMTSHVNEYFEYRVIDSTNAIQSRGIASPLGGVDAAFYAKGAIPHLNGPFHLDFYADHDQSGGYTVPNGADFPDHGWRIPLDPQDGVADVLFVHNTSFTNLEAPSPPNEIGKPATVHLTNMDSLKSKRLELRISDASAKRVVALFRIPHLDGTPTDARIPGMIDVGVNYAVDVYTDDGQGSNVGGFHLEQFSDEKGLELSFDPGTALVDPSPAPP